MRTFLVALLLLATALAGCSDGKGSTDDGPVTCPDGRVVEPVQDHGHGDNRTESEAAEHGMMEDPCFVAPSVEVAGLAGSVSAYVTDAFQWTIHNGSVASGHSMLSSLRFSTERADPAQLAGADSWGTELRKVEHNELPATFDATIRFDVPGVYYVRVYAQVRGEGFSDHDYWSEESTLNVTEIAPTGTTVTVTHALGPSGELESSATDLVLGDAVVFANEDVLPHSFTLDGACPVDAIEDVGMGESSQPVVFAEPGLCTVTTDDVQPKTLELRTAIPQA